MDNQQLKDLIAGIRSGKVSLSRTWDTPRWIITAVCATVSRK
jgi:hypothetical protein